MKSKLINIKPLRQLISLIKYSWLLIIVFLVLVTGCIDQKGPGTSVEPKDNTEDQELFSVPEEYIIYQDYLQKIGGKPDRVYDQGVIEATVLSISKTDICPYNEENCSIEPYPKDMGKVKIDKILSYIPYSEISEKTSEQSSSDTVSGDTVSREENTSSGNKGIDYPSKPRQEYTFLKEGSEYQAVLILSSRPAKIRYVPLEEDENPEEPLEMEVTASENTTIYKKVENGNKIFKPIIRENNYFIFTTKIGKYPAIIEKILPGLEIGSKLRADVYYDGTLYIGEYELI
jgi:hypothetical protein